jgi:hypothetical protein
MRAHRLSVLCATLLCAVGACADEDDPAAACARRHRSEHTIHWNGGVYTEKVVVAVPMSVTIPGGVDVAGYADCLALAGFGRGNAVEAYVERVDECRNERTPPGVRIAPSGGSRRIGGADQAAVRDCVEHRIDIDVDVPAPP